MKILSIDQSTTCSGYCICEFSNDTFTLIDYDCFKPSSKNIEMRIFETWDYLKSLICKYEPELILLEGVYYSTNKKTFSELSKLLGGLLELANIYDISTEVISSSEWRKLFNVPPKAKRKELKQLSQKFVFKNFSLDVNNDTSDSICMAYYFFRKEGDL